MNEVLCLKPKGVNTYLIITTIMIDDYSPIASSERGFKANNASFDVEIASSSHTEHSGRSRRKLILCILCCLSIIAVAAYCVHKGTFDLPTVLLGAAEDISGTDGSSINDSVGLDDNNLDNSISMISEGNNHMQDTMKEQMIKNDGDHTEAQQTIFCYGDSLTFGFITSHDEDPHPYGPSLQSELNNLYSAASSSTTSLEHSSPIIVQTLGFPGMPAHVMTKLVEQDEVGTCSIVRSTPDLSVMIILTGINDLLQLTGSGDNDSIDSAAETILTSITHLHEETLDCAQRGINKDMHILSMGIPGSQFLKSNPMASRVAAKVNEGLSSRYNTESSGRKVVFLEFPLEYDKLDQKWSKDGIHLSAIGYDELGKQLAPHVKNILDDLKR